MVFGWVLVAWCNDLFWEPRERIVDILAEVCVVVIALAVCGERALLVWVVRENLF